MNKKQQKKLIQQIIKEDEISGLYTEDMTAKEVIEKYGHLMTKEEVKKIIDD